MPNIKKGVIINSEVKASDLFPFLPYKEFLENIYNHSSNFNNNSNN